MTLRAYDCEDGNLVIHDDWEPKDRRRFSPFPRLAGDPQRGRNRFDEGESMVRSAGVYFSQVGESKHFLRKIRIIV